MEERIMTHVYVKYNPYRMETEIKVNGKRLLKIAYCIR